MLRLKLKVEGKDALFLSNSQRYLQGLSSLDLYQTVPEKVPSVEQLKDMVEQYKKSFESAVNGDRIQIVMRKKARKELTEMLKKSLLYLQAVADEDAIPALLQAGFELHAHALKRKASVAPAST